VSADQMSFKGKEKDRQHFKDNMEAYLGQFPPGAPQIDPNKLDAYFNKEQYAIWKAKFGKQTTAVITGDEVGDFAPAKIVRDMIHTPEAVDDYILKQENIVDGPGGEFVPYEFSVLKSKINQGLEPKIGGEIIGSIIYATTDLKVASEAVHKAGKSMRAKAEALSFLKESERNAYAAASSVSALAREEGRPVLVIGGILPGLETVEPTHADVKEALSAMDIDEDGTSRLNFFIQVYRASDYPIYAEYAIHRATEELAGPRQIVVLK